MGVVYILFLIPTALRDLDSSLGPYPYESIKKWVSLSSHVSSGLLERHALSLYPELCGKKKHYLCIIGFNHWMEKYRP